MPGFSNEGADLALGFVAFWYITTGSVKISWHCQRDVEGELGIY